MLGVQGWLMGPTVDSRMPKLLGGTGLHLQQLNTNGPLREARLLSTCSGEKLANKASSCLVEKLFSWHCTSLVGTCSRHDVSPLG